LPATAETAGFAPAPTLVAEEGGPGYPATGSAGDYQIMLGKEYLSTHNMLVVDERGTGLSTLIDCRPLQTSAATRGTPALRHAVRKCGRSLDHTFPRSGGGFVHASDLFTTANSTRDMARVLNLLGLDKVDFYGDSYGTYFAQSFMSHFPQRLRSVVLDSAYEARDLDPWYVTTVQTARRAFVRACARSAACAHATDPGKAWHRIGRLARSLRAHPVRGKAPGLDNHLQHVKVDLHALVNIVNDAGYDYDPNRQLDAAARAYLRHGDAAPLLRLYAQDKGYDYGGPGLSPSYFSNGQYFAISCSDYPQLFNMRDPSKQRKRQFAANVRGYPAHAFAPFTVKEWVNVDPFIEPYHICTSWPHRIHRADPPVVPHTPLDASHVPVLILNGDLDSLTPAAGGEHIHRQIGNADSRHVIAANTVHLVAVDNPHPRCGASMVRTFLSDPSTLKTLDASCASDIPAVRTVGVFPRTVAKAQPVHGRASMRVRRLAAVALAAAGDAVHRYGYINGNHDRGLRGGKINYHRTSDHVFEVAHLVKVRWTEDATVTGHVSWGNSLTHAGGTITVHQTGHKPVTIYLVWQGRQAHLGRTKLAKLSAPAP
jgi:pimeloyl-ACP methyl ester carboxylesterase